MKAKRKHIAQPEDEINLFTKPQNSPPSHRQCYTEASLLSWGLLRWHFQYRRAEGSPHGSQLQEGKGRNTDTHVKFLLPDSPIREGGESQGCYTEVFPPSSRKHQEWEELLPSYKGVFPLSLLMLFSLKFCFV